MQDRLPWRSWFVSCAAVEYEQFMIHETRFAWNWPTGLRHPAVCAEREKSVAAWK